MSTAQTSAFGLFSLLPAELRLDIWRLSCSQRVVEVYYDAQQDRCLTTTAPPAILHACRESRAEGLRIFRRSFGTGSREPRIYFCPHLDTLYLPRPGPLGYDDSARSFPDLVSDTDLVVDLAIDYVEPTIRQPWETYNKFVLMRSCPKVEEVFLVINSNFDAEGDQDAEDDRSRVLELVDPDIDEPALDDLMTIVKESFSYEAGVDLTVDLDNHEPPEQPQQEPDDPVDDDQVKPPELLQMPLPPVLLKSKVVIHQA